MTRALRSALGARLVRPTDAERRRAWQRFERALDRRLARESRLTAVGR